MKNKLYFIGRKREELYWCVRFLTLFLAIIITFCNRTKSQEFWSMLFTESNADVNARLSEAIVAEKALPGFINSMWGDVIPFDICIAIIIITMLLQVYYMKKKTKAWMTLKRLPKKLKLTFKLYILPMFFLLLVLLVKLYFVCLLIGDVRTYDGTDILVSALWNNMWRMML